MIRCIGYCQSKAATPTSRINFIRVNFIPCYIFRLINGFIRYHNLRYLKVKKIILTEYVRNSYKLDCLRSTTSFSSFGSPYSSNTILSIIRVNGCPAETCTGFISETEIGAFPHPENV